MSDDFSEFLTNTVVIHASPWADDGAGSYVRSPTAGVTLMASVQLHTAARVAYLASIGSESAGSIFFAADPIDTTSTRNYPGGVLQQRIRADDAITWQVDPDDATTWRNLVAVGPAIDEGGTGIGWRVEFRERA